MNHTTYSCKAFLASALLLVSMGMALAKDYNATDFGAKADGRTLNTVCIQAAIDYASRTGGGRVVFTPGNYVTGSIYLKDNVTLHLEAGATLLGSLNPWDYIKDPYVRLTAMIFSIKQKNIGLTGEGTINGRGFLVANKMVDYVHRGLFEDPLKLDRPQEGNRPENVIFRECENVTVKDITMRDPASWNQTYDQCRNLTIEGIKVDCKAYWNNDGLDVVDCQDVVIRNCYIDAADDAYCFKSHSEQHECNNVLLENCVGRSSANGIKFGTVSRGGFRNFTIRNMTIFDTFRSAVTFASVDGSQIENILVDGLRSIHTGNVIFLRAGVRNSNRYFKPYMKNITIRNVYAEVPNEKPDAGYNYEGPVEDLPRNISPSIIYGTPGFPVENVLIENVEIHMPGAGNPRYAYRGWTSKDLEGIPEMEKYYPEFSQWKELPAWGFFMKHAEGVTLKNVVLYAEKTDYRPAIVTDDVRGLKLENIEYVEPSSEGKTQVVTNNTTVAE